jgi:hypothetical protein
MGILIKLWFRMGAIDRRQRLFEAIVRLRRAERRVAPDQDLAAVRMLLEDELGETMSRRMAARLLGVDHKALDRWVRSGDLPLVYTPSGRHEVPVANVLELYEAVAESRATGTRTRHHIEPSVAEGRRRAELLRPRDLVGAGDERSYGRAERRGLAYHRALAKRLSRPMVDEALRTLWKWRDQGRIDARYATRWEAMLGLPLTEVKRIIGEDSQRGRDLRQNSPFAGMLSEAERRRINDEVG